MRGIPLTNEELERLEKYHLEQLYYYLKSNEERLMMGLRSKDKIHDDWWNQFKKGGKATDLDRGAERIFYWVLAGIWTPNSAPIGSNLFFETHDAFVHIEVKTSKIDYPADYRGLVPISERQTSYEIVKRTGKNPSLPTYYNKGRKTEKACLTYAIQLIHNPETLEMIAILLISIPNGQLYDLYGDKIVGGGKVKGASFRYRYKEAPRFEALSDKPYRIRLLYWNKAARYNEEDITAVKGLDEKALEELR